MRLVIETYRRWLATGQFLCYNVRHKNGDPDTTDFKSLLNRTHEIGGSSYEALSIPPPYFSLKYLHCTQRRKSKSFFLFALKCVLPSLLLVFFVFAGNVQAQTTCPYTLPTSPTDQDILRLFYCATGGPNWTNSHGFPDVDLTQDIQQSPGLHISNGKLLKIDLFSNNLVGTIPAELGHLSDLQELKLYSNKLSGEIPAELGDLTALRTFGCTTMS